MGTSFSKGLVAEQIVQNYFLHKGFRVVANRYKRPSGEIDLIIKKDLIVIFVEVKFRKILPQENIISVKQRKRIITTASCFLHENPMYNTYIKRFDGVFLDAAMRFLHIEGMYEVTNEDFQDTEWRAID